MGDNMSSSKKNVSSKKKNSKKKKKQSKNKFWVYFLAAFIVISASCLAMGSTIILKLSNISSEDGNSVNKENTIIQSTENNNIISSIFGEKQIKTNVAVFGTDEDGFRTDVIFVVTFDSKTKKIGLVSVPRDTRVSITDGMVEFAKEKGKSIEKGFTCKINEIHAYAPKKYRSEFSVMQLEDLLNIKIDYYVKVDLKAFRSIVDAFGGVDIDVPQDMDYEDPYQDLYIHLKKGMQHLDGEKAEQLIRFRSYPQGDVARVEVQQLFLKEFAKKVLNTKNIMDNIGEIIKTVYSYVETNFGIDDILKYVKYIKDISLENLTMETIPGEGKYVGGISYYIHDAAGTRELVDKVFYDLTVEEPFSEENAKEVSATIKPTEKETQSTIEPMEKETQSTIKPTEKETQSTVKPTEKATQSTVKSTEKVIESTEKSTIFIDIITEEDSKDRKIEVLNGSFTNGKAAEFRDKLQEAGYNVTQIGTYTGNKEEYTRIIVSEESVGYDLKKYFNSSKIEISSKDLDEDIDIRIIVGTGE